jgi:hypothetical protein
MVRVSGQWEGEGVRVRGGLGDVVRACVLTMAYTYYGLYLLWPILTMAYTYYGLYLLWPILTMAYTYYGLRATV